ncbi:Uncharacterised protein [Bordetella pertussis]|nr:Uncharacterised protein [Bordetella pertussis]
MPLAAIEWSASAKCPLAMPSRTTWLNRPS